MTGPRLAAPLVVLVLASAATIGVRAEDATGALQPRLQLSSDAEGNDVRKLSLGWDWKRVDREHWLGAEVQHARFSGDGWAHDEQRVYLGAAGVAGQGPVDDDAWRWQARLGSNGHTVLGSASIHTEGPRRREVFFERELLETRAGIERRQMYNFLGAAIDHPFSDRFSGTVLAGVQTFGDSNRRDHLRANLVYAVAPEQGISIQLRNRYYRNSEPYTGGYFSPPWYAETVAAVGVRRVVGGHAWRVIAGSGRQRTADEGWKRARVFELGYESPRWRQSWLRVSAGYSDTPVATSTRSATYSYRYLMLESVVAF